MTPEDRIQRLRVALTDLRNAVVSRMVCDDDDWQTRAIQLVEATTEASRALYETEAAA